MSQNLYELLGVTKRVDADTLKKAYRKLAKELHPDQNPGNKQIELRFKAINQAYAVLSDAKKRAHYDEFGDESLKSGFDPAKARARAKAANQSAPRGEPVRVETVYVKGVSNDDDVKKPSNGFDMLGTLLGRRRKSGVRGSDYETEITIDFGESVRGTTRLLRGLPGALALSVKIPRGVHDGKVIRIPNEGAPSVGDGPNGDLLLKIRVKPHRHFYREGDDLHLRLPLTLREAYFGAKVKVPTPDRAVDIKVPARSQTGTVLRVRNKGIASETGPAGDLLVYLMVQAPTAEGLEIVKAVEKIAETQTADPRAGLEL